MRFAVARCPCMAAASLRLSPALCFAFALRAALGELAAFKCREGLFGFMQPMMRDLSGYFNDVMV